MVTCYAPGMEFKRPFSDADWLATPEPVREYIVQLEQTIIKLASRLEQLEKRTEKLEGRAKQNSHNSSKPPSSDSPFDKSTKKSNKKTRKRGGQIGHKGHQQTLLEPTEVVVLTPDQCLCGGTHFDSVRLKPFYTHQFIELPEIKMDVTHFILHQGRCLNCGKTARASLPQENQTGYGPRLCAVVGELSGMHGASRETVQSFCQSVFGFPISTGAIQNIIDRVSCAIEPGYARIAEIVRSSLANHVDETSWKQSGKLRWLWTMVNENAAFFMIHPNRSKAAFDRLIEDWKGILISDGYNLYRNWANRRQTCLAHYIRKATALSESKNESTRTFGMNIKSDLQLLCGWGKKSPNEKQWTEFISRFTLLLILHEGADDEAGELARSLGREIDSLWVFLEEKGVEPTNNRAERALRFGVIWRKRSKGTQSDKGNRWVERILSFKETCRMKGLAQFHILKDSIECYFKELAPDLSWLE